jgi:hypothetical protein
MDIFYVCLCVNEVVVICKIFYPNAMRRITISRVSSYHGLCEKGISAHLAMMFSDDINFFAPSSMAILARTRIPSQIQLRSYPQLRLQNQVSKWYVTKHTSSSVDADTCAPSRI